MWYIWWEDKNSKSYVNLFILFLIQVEAQGVEDKRTQGLLQGSAPAAYPQ